MAHYSSISFDEGKDYMLISCDYQIDQPVLNGQPNGYPTCGKIKITLVTPDNEDMFFFEWMKQTVGHKDGEIFFQVVNEGKASTKTLKFEGAFCISLREDFSFLTDSQMTTTIEFLSEKVTFGGGGENANEANAISFESK